MLTRRGLLKVVTLFGTETVFPIRFLWNRTASDADTQNADDTSTERRLKSEMWAVIGAIDASGELANAMDLNELISRHTDSVEVRKRVLVYLCMCDQCREERLDLIARGTYG